jgi:hypothetical protein
MDDRQVLESLPLPIARGLRRHRNATEVRERHDAAYYLFEIYLKYAAAIAIARYLAEDDPLYTSERWFPSQGSYRIPLLPGNFQVTLHFAELVHEQPGARRFDVRLEGTEVLTDYEPLKAGYATAEVKPFPVTVEDGILDIDFIPRVDHPKLSAIEVERLK